MNWGYDATYRLTSPFGMRVHPVDGVRKFHRGVDLVVSPSDGPLKAFVAGEVVHAKLGAAGSGFGNYGIVVAIKDKAGYLHVYAHMSLAAVKVGDKVAKGQYIGKQGNTGKSAGAHLHYEVRKAAAPSFGYTSTEAGVVEPTQYLENYYAKEVQDLAKTVLVHDVNVKVKNIKIKDGLLIEGTTYVPLRDVGEALGLKVSWDKASNTASLTE